MQLLELHLFEFGLYSYSESNSWAGDPKQIAPISADLDQARVCANTWVPWGFIEPPGGSTGPAGAEQ